MKTQREMIITFSNGQKYAVPVDNIAYHRAQYYFNAGRFNSMDDALEQTATLFEDVYEIEDWTSNMEWAELEPYARLVSESEFDYDADWKNCKKEFF